jgi:hypothetical protein
MAGAGSGFTQETQSDGSIRFTVTPTRIKNGIGAIAIAALVGFFFAFSGGPNGTSWFQIAFGVAIGYGVHLGIIWWRTRKLNPGGAPRGGTFCVDDAGLVLDGGQKIARADIRVINEQNTSNDAANPDYLLGTDTAKGVFLLATGMDAGTAVKLRSAVMGALRMQEPTAP